MNEEKKVPFKWEYGEESISLQLGMYANNQRLYIGMITHIEITDPSIKEFEKIARKYGVDYAVKKDRSSSPPKYLIFFKGRDADALTAAFTEYTSKKVKKAEKTERPSVLAKLSQFKEMVKNAVVDRTKRKELER